MAPLGEGAAPMLHVGIRQQEPYGLGLRRAIDALPLSPAQREVCALLHVGRSTTDIAASLSISPATVADHVKKIYAPGRALCALSCPPASTARWRRAWPERRCADNAASAKPPYAVPDTFEHPLDAASSSAAHRAGVELYRAHIVRHAFEPHPRAYGLGAIGAGVERSATAAGAPGTSRHAGADEPRRTAHRPRRNRRRLALPHGLPRRAAAGELSGERGWWFADRGPRRRQRAAHRPRLLRQLWHANEPLAFDALLQDLVDELRPSARRATPRDGALPLLSRR